MAKACVYIGLYIRLFSEFGVKSICAIRTIPHADLAVLDAVCSLWYSDGENESENAKMVPCCVGSGSCGVFGMELV